MARRRTHAPLVLPAGLAVGDAHHSTIVVDGTTFERIVVRTPWLAPGADLARIMADQLRPLSEPGDLLIVTEKVVVAASGRGVPGSQVRPGRLARFLAGRVQPIEGSRGLSIPEKMQLVLDHVGVGRVLVAAVAGAITRAMGLHGVFYMIAGRFARDLDGMRTPYDDVLLPPLSPEDGRRIVENLAAELERPVAIVDMNDRGGSIRAITTSAIKADLLRRILEDNPLGQSAQSTPIGIVRAAASRMAAAEPRGSWGRRLATRLLLPRGRGQRDDRPGHRVGLPGTHRADAADPPTFTSNAVKPIQ